LRQRGVVGSAAEFIVLDLESCAMTSTSSVFNHSPTKPGSPMVPACQLALDANFGNVKRWADTAAALAITQGNGGGQLLLMFKPADGSLVNRWVANAADLPAPDTDDPGDVPILAWDVAALLQHVVAKAAATTPADVLLQHTDWEAVYARYQHAVHHASEAFAAQADDTPGAMLLDVRRAGVFEQASTMIPGATWRDPAAVSTWAADVPRHRAVIVYCIYGHEVGRATALRLRGAGVHARFLQGGIDGWQGAGRAVVNKSQSST
jgi:superoxide dismutase, Fe-Mn family